MSNLATRTESLVEFTPAHIELIKTQIAPGASDDELRLFLAQCQRTGLDPLSRQIYAVMREESKNVNGQWVKTAKMAIQVSIDGFRVIAERHGQYAGRVGPFWCGEDGKWVDVWLSNAAPAAAKVGIMRHGFKEPLWAVARFEAYASRKRDGALMGLWAKMPDVMIAKCFDERTEVLTTHGFQRFSEVTGRIMQVTDQGLEATDAQPFVQDWTGDMVTLESDDLNFCVTPSHEMLTTNGKIQAGDMYAQARVRPKFHIPRSVQGSRTEDETVPDESVMIAAAHVADGSDIAGGFRIEVSRPAKVELLRDLSIHTKERVRAAAGQVATLRNGREITTKSDKQSFSYSESVLCGLIGRGKVINISEVLKLSRRQIRLFIDTWMKFDGHSQVKTGVRRIYTSRLDHVAAFEVLAVAAGYATSPRRSRATDGSERPNFYLTISGRDAIPVIRWGEGSHRTGMEITQNTGGKVWCVTVPSGLIVVRRHGFSMICGNCAESQALRAAFPNDLSGLYGSEEMQQADTAQVVEVQQIKTDPAAAAWAEKARQMQERVVKAFPQAASDIHELFESLPNWELSLESARGMYEGVRDIGLEYKKEQDAPVDVTSDVLAPEPA